MRSSCEIEQLFEGYFRSDLSPAEELALLNHLKTCENCRVQLDNFYTIHMKLLQYKRSAVPSDLKNLYYQQVDLSFGRETISDKFNLFFNTLLGKQSPLVRIIQFATLIVVGLAAGWLIFAPAEPQIIFHNTDPYQTSQPISAKDLQDVHSYLQISEMILLQIQNDTDFYLNRELAQKLLIKTFKAKNIALQLENLHMINFLNRMEILLHDVSNLDEEDMTESIAIIRQMIETYNLLEEVEILKSYFTIKKEQFGT